ncbi:MAG: hypothetical protein IJ560_04425, partial [Alphaproteobacteria bacterium]|nr:hypothetical protein [Alphaproteobacteria bacterium]
VHNRWRVDDSDTLITTNTTIPFSYVRDIKLTAAVDMTQDYVIDNGRLLWANPNLYLESSNGAAINTGYKPNFNTSIECRLMTFTSGSNGDPFGAKTAAYYNPNVIGFGIITRGKAISGFMLGNKQDDSVVRPLTTGQWYEMYLNANGLARVDSQEYNLGTPAALPDLPLSMFGCNNYGNQSSIDARFSYLKIMETDFVVLHMVPVPAGLRIGNYTVPSNGMWDMVEQKFYQNSGTGEFIYGRD